MTASEEVRVTAGGDFELVEPIDRAAWRAWLADHHEQPTSIWLVLRKKGAGEGLAYEDAAEEAIAWGWIDSRPNKLDEARYRLLLSPRKPGSRWSRTNRQRAARLEAAGLMAPPGAAAIAAAKADGSWDALDAVQDLVVPDDLAAALAARSPADCYFEAFPPSARRAILEWISGAKKPQTRAKRVEETARLAADNVRANQWRQPKG